MYPSTVRFPVSAAAGISLTMESLVGLAPEVGLYVGGGDAYGLRAVLDGMKLPRALHSAAAGDFAVGLALSQVRFFDESKVHDLMRQMTSTLYLQGVNPEKPGWEPLVSDVPENYTGQWIGDKAGLNPFNPGKNENQALRWGHHNNLMERVDRLRGEYRLFQEMLSSEGSAYVRAQIELAIDSGRYNALELMRLAVPLGSGTIWAHNYWGDMNRESAILEKGRKGELMSQEDYAQALQCAVRKRELQDLEKTMTVSQPLKTLSLGRADGNDLVIPHSVISGKHAFLHIVDTPFGKRLAIEDRGSTHGIYVRSMRLEPNRKFLLEQGDIFYFGPVPLKNMVSPEMVLRGIPLMTTLDVDGSMLIIAPKLL